MPRIILNIGPLKMDEVTLTNGEKAYRFFVRSSGNSIARLQTLRQLKIALERELMRKGAMTDRLAKDKENYYKNREQRLARQRAYYAENREVIIQKKREYRRKNKDIINLKQRQARAAKKASQSG